MTKQFVFDQTVLDRQLRLFKLHELLLGARIAMDSWMRITADDCAEGSRNTFVVARYVDAKQRVALLTDLIALEAHRRFPMKDGS